MPKIFMCYRRDDTLGVAGRVYERLIARYGQEDVFRDLDDIPGGADFIEASETALRSATAFVVLIGKDWMQTESGGFQPRIHEPGDRVRIEIELAIKHNVAIFPVLVQGAAMPREKELPQSIVSFSRRNASPLDAHTFDHHMEQVLNDLARVTGEPASRSPNRGWAEAAAGFFSSFQKRNAPAQREPSYPQPAAPPDLAQLLSGNWQLQISYPNGMMAQGGAQFGRGQFMVQGISPAGQFEIQGTWQVDPSNLLHLTGQQTAAFNVLPYAAIIQFSMITAQQLQGAANTGEQITLTRTG